MQLKLCFHHFSQVSVNFSKDKAKPAEEVSLKVKASPNSLCSYGVLDKSVVVESGRNNQLTLAEVLDFLRNIGINEYSGYVTGISLHLYLFTVINYSG